MPLQFCNLSLPAFVRDVSQLEMSQLQHRHLMTLTLNVDFAGMVSIGKIPLFLRSIAPITSGQFIGESLSGKVLPGGKDWTINRLHAVMVLTCD